MDHHFMSGVEGRAICVSGPVSQSQVHFIYGCKKKLVYKEGSIYFHYEKCQPSDRTPINGRHPNIQDTQVFLLQTSSRLLELSIVIILSRFHHLKILHSTDSSNFIKFICKQKYPEFKNV